ncbi:glycosyltransferase family 2 protein [Pelagibacterium xiamenense]|uniref:glycosyltransferase family 2 protein n=1 Tax=Pelagibacterium xiamenense TaxID=2901140 RepID=UPI001E46218F|nr:glycosyltransferase [Pelagibacterium xiamenense]MCD7058914.1 glycosyltransferase [Pelagibacterium xiamenense]
MPKVTVLLPVYNGLPYLRDALACLLDQTLADIEILALDDGSTDGSLAYLNSIQDPRLKVAPSGRNLGLGATLQRGLDTCQTPLFARMDADDLCDRDRLRLQYEFLAHNPDVAMVGCQFHYFGQSGRKAMTPRLPVAHADIEAGLQTGQLSIIHGAMMARTETMRAAGGYRVSGMGEDWDMFLRFSEVGRMANLEADLYGYRYHAGNVSLKHLERQTIGIAYARDCARRRRAGMQEISYAAFLGTARSRPIWTRIADKLDVMALRQYRIAIAELAEGRRISGHLNLLAGAALSPGRAISRLTRDRARTKGQTVSGGSESG